LIRSAFRCHCAVPLASAPTPRFHIRRLDEFVVIHDVLRCVFAFLPDSYRERRVDTCIINDPANCQRAISTTSPVYVLTSSLPVCDRLIMNRWQIINIAPIEN